MAAELELEAPSAQAAGGAFASQQDQMEWEC